MTDIANIIKELELSLLKPEVRASREILEKLLADDFFEVGSSGNTYTKTDILERLPHTTEKIEYVVSDFSVDIPSETTAITRYKTKMTIQGQHSINSLRGSRWRNENGTWRMFSHKAVPVE